MAGRAGGVSRVLPPPEHARCRRPRAVTGYDPPKKARFPSHDGGTTAAGAQEHEGARNPSGTRGRVVARRRAERRREVRPIGNGLGGPFPIARWMEWSAGLTREGAMTVKERKERLHRLVDALEERELDTAAHVLEGLAVLARTDPLARALVLAPADDELLTDADRAELAEGWADYQAGRGVSSDDVRRELGLA